MSTELRRIWRVRQDKYDGLYYPEYCLLPATEGSWRRFNLGHRHNWEGYRTAWGARQFVTTGPQFGKIEGWAPGEEPQKKGGPR